MNTRLFCSHILNTFHTRVGLLSESKKSGLFAFLGISGQLIEREEICNIKVVLFFFFLHKSEEKGNE